MAEILLQNFEKTAARITSIHDEKTLLFYNKTVVPTQLQEGQSRSFK